MPKKSGSTPTTSSLTLAVSRHPEAVAEARHFVAGCLVDALEDLRENAELVTSELVTNVLVHTDSDVTLNVKIEGATLRVEVYDDCAVLPVGGILDWTAASGRGLFLVDQLTHRWGITRVPGAGKNVWFELVGGVPTPGDDLSAEDLLAMWDDEDLSSPAFDVAPVLSPDDPATSSAQDPSELTRVVRVEDVSTHLLNSSKSHLDDLARDLTLVTEAAASGEAQDDDLLALGCKLGQLAVDLVDFRNDIRRQALDAAHCHQETMTLVVEVATALRDRLIDYGEALDEADEFCKDGRLLVPPAPPEHVEFRRWKLNRIIEQLPEEGTREPPEDVTPGG